MNDASEPIVHTREDYGIREGAEEYPLMLVLSYIYPCNAKCPHCPYTNSDIRTDYRKEKGSFMPDEIFHRIADESGPYGAYLRLTGGGEPMMHPKAVEHILYAKEKGCKIGLITNGSLFNEKKLTTIIEAGVDMIEFSVDAGDAETYQWTRQGLKWDRVVANAKMAVEIRNKVKNHTRIICSAINQKNVDIEQVQAFWEPIVDKVQIRKFLTWGYDKDKIDIEGDNSANDQPYLPPEERVPCPWLFERFNIDSLGYVTLCGEDIAFREQFANVMERSIKDIWNGEEFGYFRKKHLDREGHHIKICSECPDWQYRSWNYNYWKLIEDADKKKEDLGITS